MNSNTPIYPHGNVEEIADDLFMLRGSIKMNPLVRITRNMGIIKNGDELSLINPLRVNEKVEAQIAKLGKIKHIIRLGCFHGVDDPYYVEKFGAQMWAQLGGTTYAVPKIDKELDSIAPLPFEDGEIFEFAGTTQPECALLIRRGTGTLFTCDAIQNYGNYSYNNIPAKILLPFIGFPRATIVGPMWLKYQTQEGETLELEFRRLLELRFDKLLAAHGTLLETGAHAAVEKAINKVFEKKK
tara:strand:- start:6042 stop:6764 length:723 start_codon:yes stop_codon:yes gene_type:complete